MIYRRSVLLRRYHFLSGTGIYLNGDDVKKRYAAVSAALGFCFGAVIYFSYRLSGHAAWSLIISAVNSSAWELFKPFGISYLAVIPIELSWLRPELRKFICARMTGVYVLAAVIIGLAMLCRIEDDRLYYPLVMMIAAAGEALSAVLSYRLYYSRRYISYLLLPAVVTIFAVVFMILILTFYPPQWGIFYDFRTDSVSLENMRAELLQI